MLLCSWFGDIFANESRNITYLPVLIFPATSILGWSRAMGTMAPSEILAVLEPIRERALFHSEGHRQAIIEHHKGWVVSGRPIGANP
jgi:hypothetical protein